MIKDNPKPNVDISIRFETEINELHVEIRKYKEEYTRVFLMYESLLIDIQNQITINNRLKELVYELELKIEIHNKEFAAQELVWRQQIEILSKSSDKKYIEISSSRELMEKASSDVEILRSKVERIRNESVHLEKLDININKKSVTTSESTVITNGYNNSFTPNLNVLTDGKNSNGWLSSSKITGGSTTVTDRSVVHGGSSTIVTGGSSYVTGGSSTVVTGGSSTVVTGGSPYVLGGSSSVVTGGPTTVTDRTVVTGGSTTVTGSSSIVPGSSTTVTGSSSGVTGGSTYVAGSSYSNNNSNYYGNYGSKNN